MPIYSWYIFSCVFVYLGNKYRNSVQDGRLNIMCLLLLSAVILLKYIGYVFFKDIV